MVCAAPDAGTLQQQIDRERPMKLPNQAAPLEPAPKPLKSIPSETIIVKAFVFSGNTLLTSEYLASVIADYLNRPINFNELQEAASAVAAAYREAGWVVQAYIPGQDITEGTITIQIIEAVFGDTRFDGSSSLRLKMDYMLGAIETAQVKGEPRNAKKLDRVILLMDDLPGITAAGSLRKGKGPNETDLVLKMADEPLINAEVDVDNTGPRSTGKERISGKLYVNSPLGIGDQITTDLIHSRGNDYGRLAYSIPVGMDGWRVGVAASYLSYDLIADDFCTPSKHMRQN
jgi:hemolysin activation/secretion protein